MNRSFAAALTLIAIASAGCASMPSQRSVSSYDEASDPARNEVFGQERAEQDRYLDMQEELSTLEYTADGIMRRSELEGEMQSMRNDLIFSGQSADHLSALGLQAASERRKETRELDGSADADRGEFAQGCLDAMDPIIKLNSKPQSQLTFAENASLRSSYLKISKCKELAQSDRKFAKIWLDLAKAATE